MVEIICTLIETFGMIVGCGILAFALIMVAS